MPWFPLVSSAGIFNAPEYLRNVIRIVTETGLRIYKELVPMTKENLHLDNAVVWIPDSKTPNGVAEVPLTAISIEAFRRPIAISGPGPYLFSSDENSTGHQLTIQGSLEGDTPESRCEVFPDL